MRPRTLPATLRGCCSSTGINVFHLIREGAGVNSLRIMEPGQKLPLLPAISIWGHHGRKNLKCQVRGDLIIIQGWQRG